MMASMRSVASYRATLLALTLALELVASSVAAETPLAGHLAYAVGSAEATDRSGVSHGLDAALVIPWHDMGDRVAFGASGLWGFGPTPSYIELDAGFAPNGADHPFASTFLGGGPVVRLPKDGRGFGYGLGLRLAHDIYFFNVGLRALLTYGDDSTNGTFLLSVGLGRL